MQISNMSFGTKLLVSENTRPQLVNCNDSVADGILIAGEMLKTNNSQDEFVITTKPTLPKQQLESLQLTYFDENKKHITATRPLDVLKNKNSTQVALTLINIKNGLRNMLSNKPVSAGLETTKDFKTKKIMHIFDKHGFDDFTCP